jgi:hypothetical protein
MGEVLRADSLTIIGNGYSNARPGCIQVDIGNSHVDAASLGNCVEAVIEQIPEDLADLTFHCEYLFIGEKLLLARNGFSIEFMAEERKHVLQNLGRSKHTLMTSFSPFI